MQHSMAFYLSPLGILINLFFLVCVIISLSLTTGGEGNVKNENVAKKGDYGMRKRGLFLVN